MRTKDQVRRDVWKSMDREGVSRFPGAEGRIPNFAGAKLAARKLSAKQVREAATIKGALRHGLVVADEDLPDIDFVLCGSVAVNLSGARVGKGGGYSDLEYGVLIHAGKINDP